MEENVDDARRVEVFRLYSLRSDGASRRNMKNAAALPTTFSFFHRFIL